MKKVLLILAMAMMFFACGAKGSKGSTFSLNLGAEPKSIDPQLSTDIAGGTVNELLSEGLLKRTPDGKPDPGIAEKWEVSPDGLKWTFHLRDAKWSNGDPITANDFKAAWIRGLDPKVASEYAYMLYPIKNGELFNKGKVTADKVGIKVVDPKTLEVTLESPTPYFADLVTFKTYSPINEKFLKAVKQKDSSITPALFYTKSQAWDQGPRAFVANLYNSWITDDANSKYTINDANGVKGLEWVKKAYDDGLLGQGVALEAKDALEAFKSGRAATTILFSPGIAASHASGFNYKFLPFPNNGGKAKYDYLVAGPAIFDNGDADKAAAAKKFVDFMVNDKDWGKRTLLASGNFSAKKGETGLYDSEELKFAEGLTGQYAPYYNTIPGFAKMRPLWFNMVQGVLNGKTTPKEGLDKFVEDANKTIKEAL